MSVNEKTRSVPSSPMGLSPRSDDRDEPDDQGARRGHRRQNRRTADRRKLPRIEEMLPHRGRRQEETEAGQHEKTEDRPLRKEVVRAGEEKRCHAAREILLSDSATDLGAL